MMHFAVVCDYHSCQRAEKCPIGPVQVHGQVKDARETSLKWIRKRQLSILQPYT